jgi:hypothetical protein
LADTFAASTSYTFRGYSIESGPQNDIRFYIGYDSGSGFVELANATFDLDSFNEWTLLDGVTYSTGVAGAELGQNIIVRVGTIQTVGTNGDAAWFDAMSLTTAQVPEPTSILLLALAAGIGLGARRLR